MLSETQVILFVMKSLVNIYLGYCFLYEKYPFLPEANELNDCNDFGNADSSGSREQFLTGSKVKIHYWKINHSIGCTILFFLMIHKIKLIAS